VAFRVSDIAADIASAVAACGVDRPTLVGHSLGGWVAVSCAARYGVASRLVTLDGPFGLERPAAVGRPSPPDAPEWHAVERAPEVFGVAEDVDLVAVPWLAVLCDTRDKWADLRRPLAERIASGRQRRVLWEAASHDDLINSARALRSAGEFGVHSD
jgi:pimeloyl-ACP methyl ester carboxylesterase